jgi:NAD(P)-dependent dehydrogenase (short-subunit alcohol dehydrogenase family)
MSRTAVVTGGSSGVGRATAIRLAKDGWRVAVVGTREDALAETIKLSGRPDQMLAAPCDIGDADAVFAMAKRVAEKFGFVELSSPPLGRTSPTAVWKSSHPMTTARCSTRTSTALYYCVQAFLPHMRQQKRGTIVVVNSLAGLKASGLVRRVLRHVQVRRRRARAVDQRGRKQKRHPRDVRLPGDINTPLLEQATQPARKGAAASTCSSPTTSPIA